MGDATVRPSTGDDLVVQNDDGTSKIELNENDTIVVTSGGDVTIDATGDIVLDADGAEVFLKDAGVDYGVLKQVSGDLVIQPTTGKQIILNEDGGAAALTIDADGDVNIANNVDSGTITSSVVFPAGHIIQSDFSPTLSNTDTGSKTSATGIADIIDQMTITSGNGVLMHVSAWCITTASTNSFGSLSICEGTIASPSTEISRVHFGMDGAHTMYSQVTILAYDSSPASTTPDYYLSIERGSAHTTGVNVYSFSASYFKWNIFEIQQ